MKTFYHGPLAGTKTVQTQGPDFNVLISYETGYKSAQRTTSGRSGVSPMQVLQNSAQEKKHRLLQVFLRSKVAVALSLPTQTGIWYLSKHWPYLAHRNVISPEPQRFPGRLGSKDSISKTISAKFGVT